jgi:hypothetical protein
MAKKQGGAPKIKIGELKNVVSGLKERNTKLSADYDKTNEGLAMGAGINQIGIGPMQMIRSREMDHNDSKINRYSRIIDSTTIAHDRARLAEKEASFKRDYPLSETFISKPAKKKQ